MTDQEAQERLAGILGPLLEECLDIFEDWEAIDTEVMADNLSVALVELGIVPPQTGPAIDDVPTGDLL